MRRVTKGGSAIRKLNQSKQNKSKISCKTSAIFCYIICFMMFLQLLFLSGLNPLMWDDQDVVPNLNKLKGNDVKIIPEGKIEEQQSEKTTVIAEDKETISSPIISFSSLKADSPKIFTAYAEPQLEYDPMPDRKNKLSEEKLTKYEYPQVKGCVLGKGDTSGIYTLADQLPVNPPSDEDKSDKGIPIPPDVDAFLPWLHDVFASDDGELVHFVGQHRRRCHVGHASWLERYIPQSALFQHVPVKRKVTMKDSSEENIYQRGDNGAYNINKVNVEYQLASHEEADKDGGVETRFICRFHTNFAGQSPEIHETLSVFPFDLDYVTYRKGYPASFTGT